MTDVKLPCRNTVHKSLSFYYYYYYYYYKFQHHVCHCRLFFITNDQRLTELSFLHISNTFLNILAVPNKAVFCITPALNGIPSFPIHLSNPLVTLPRAPITTGTTSTILSFHSLPISLFKSWYFSTFSLSFFLHQLVQQYR